MAESAKTFRAESAVFFIVLRFFDCHVAELIRVEDLAALQALDILGVLFARYNAHFWMFAGGVHYGHLSGKFS